MVTVCAWCDRFLGLKEQEPIVVTHGICDPCFARQSWEDDPPTLVISKDREHLLPVLAQVLRGLPEIRVVVDRRHSERRARGDEAGVPDRRQKDRRRSTDLMII